MTRDSLVADRLYYVAEHEMYFYTPDGVGGYWYETQSDAFDDVGIQRVYIIDHLEDW